MWGAVFHCLCSFFSFFQAHSLLDPSSMWGVVIHCLCSLFFLFKLIPTSILHQCGEWFSTACVVFFSFFQAHCLSFSVACFLVPKSTQSHLLNLPPLPLPLHAPQHPLIPLPVGQSHIYTYTVHVRFFWQGDHQIYGHVRCMFTVLANPTYL